MLKRGSVIGIPCEVKPGPFSSEQMISFETADGVVTGFVHPNELAQRSDGTWRVRAIVQKTRGDVVEVRVVGSFFTTNGLANIKREALAA